MCMGRKQWADKFGALTNKDHTSRLLRQPACQLEDASHVLVGLTIPLALQVAGLDGNEERLTLLGNGLQIADDLRLKIASVPT